MKIASDELRRIASGRLFQARGAATAKARSPIVVHRVAGTMRSADDAERRRRRDSALATQTPGVLQIARCGPLNALVNQYAQLVLDAASGSKLTTFATLDVFPRTWQFYHTERPPLRTAATVTAIVTENVMYDRRCFEIMQSVMLTTELPKPMKISICNLLTQNRLNN